ncbi:UNVERIFIED_CONTAM: F-box protein [Sesamum latifolium]|uniref:F-box protein n=1 Tax=Sesamum latifolium TaxID=2727402 RepID=A0AAW2XSE4_9LAMI
MLTVSSKKTMMNRVAMHNVLVINDDIVKEILSYLPVKSLLRFKTVRKSWQDIIGSWAFVKLHLENHCNNCSDNQGILVRGYDGNSHKWKLSTKIIDCSKLRGESTLDGDCFMDPISRNEIPCCSRMIGPIDGLTCIYGIRPSTAIALYNPSLAETQFLPMSPISSTCNPDAYRRDVGFGFDYVHKDLKVVQLSIFSALSSEIRVEVYSQSTNTWKELDHQIPNDMLIQTAIMPYKNGSLSFSHWLAFKSSRRVGGANYIILSFNLQNEVFEETPLPRRVHVAAYEGEVKLGFLAEDDSLILLFYPLRRLNSPGDVVFERWVLNGLGDEGRWTRLSSISAGPLVEASEPLILWKNRALVWEDYGMKKKLVFYNYCTQEVTNVIVIPPKQRAPSVLGYKGSLISPAIFMKAQL